MTSADTYINTLVEAINSTKNDVIIFTVVIIIALMAVVIPFYVIHTKNKQKETDLNNKRENLLIETINRNTEAVTSLKEVNNNIHETVNETNKRMIDISDGITKVLTIVKDNRHHIGEIERSNNKIEAYIQDIGEPLDNVNTALRNHVALDLKLDTILKNFEDLKEDIEEMQENK